MRVVVTGASGNVGTSLVRALAADEDIEEIVGLARRLPVRDLHGVEWRATNIEDDDLVPLFRDADCVVPRIRPARRTGRRMRAGPLRDADELLRPPQGRSRAPARSITFRRSGRRRVSCACGRG